MIAETLARMKPDDLVMAFTVTMFATCGTLIAIVGILAAAWRRVTTVRQRGSLTLAMIERGLGSEEIARVLGLQEHDLRDEPLSLPNASEVVAESDDEWLPALVLQVAGNRYLVHFVGKDMDENEWVGVDRIRFPADSKLPGYTETAERARFADARPPVKQPLEVEL